MTTLELWRNASQAEQAAWDATQDERIEPEFNRIKLKLEQTLAGQV